MKLGFEPFKHIFIQCVFVTFSVLLSAFSWGHDVAIALLLGGVANVVPNAYFCWKMSRQTGAQNAKAILKNFYRGEVSKLLLTAAIFGLIFRFIPVTILPVFVGFIIAQSAFWVSLLILKSERVIVKS